MHILAYLVWVQLDQFFETLASIQAHSTTEYILITDLFWLRKVQLAPIYN